MFSQEVISFFSWTNIFISLMSKRSNEQEIHSFIFLTSLHQEGKPQPFSLLSPGALVEGKYKMGFSSAT